MINYAGYKRNLSEMSAEESNRKFFILINELNELQSQKCKKEDISPEEIQPLTKICQDELGI